MHAELELAYLGIETPEPATLEPFFGSVIGLVPGEPTTDGATTWRNDHAAHRIILEDGPANDARFIGFELPDLDAFDAAVARFARIGNLVEHGTAAVCAARRVERIASTHSPWGMTIELVVGLADASAPYQSSSVPGGFLTDGVGFGHVVVATTAFEASHEFVTGGLGMTQSDWLQTEIAPGIELEVRFYHCNARHHTIALANAPFEMPQKLHHVMFETHEIDDVGAAFDRACRAELDIAQGLGRHDNDAMFSFYVKSPAGFLVEVGHGARSITEPWHGNRRYDRISRWGHQPLGVVG